MYDFLHPEFPEVCYFDNSGKAGRTRTEFSKKRFDWSTSAAQGKRQDYVPTPFAEATYLINFAVLKGHSAGITLCAKNLYGALLRCPDGYLRDEGREDYYDLHATLPDPRLPGVPGLGKYRALVDLMGHSELGGKTLLCLVDGLFAGYYWDSHPVKWKMPPFGDGAQGDWPSSLFASQDPVAIDSVGHDFLLREWPKVVTTGGGATGALQGGAEDYLHEAAEAAAPPSGTFYDPDRSGRRLASLGVHEHWNDATRKQYSRNLGLNAGIELVTLKTSRPPVRLDVRPTPFGVILAWPSAFDAYRLEAASSLVPPVTWQPIAATPARAQGLSTVTEPLTASNRFYRLAR
jgi:hypothetical protein